jgi:hypothetical protein
MPTQLKRHALSTRWQIKENIVPFWVEMLHHRRNNPFRGETEGKTKCHVVSSTEKRFLLQREEHHEILNRSKDQKDILNLSLNLLAIGFRKKCVANISVGIFCTSLRNSCYTGWRRWRQTIFTFRTFSSSRLWKPIWTNKFCSWQRRWLHPGPI